MVTTRMDEKGRISIPSTIREELGLESGDMFFLDIENQILRIAKATNPFDALIEEGIDELQSGKTVNLRDFAADEGIEIP